MPLKFADKDFVDKHIKFVDNGTLYCYYSSLDEKTGLDIKYLPSGTDRSTNFIGIQKLERNNITGQIHYKFFI
jgi:hypothetical protein